MFLAQHTSVVIVLFIAKVFAAKAYSRLSRVIFAGSLSPVIAADMRTSTSAAGRKQLT